MYIVELFFKIKNQLKERKYKVSSPRKKETYEQCSHILVPIDSTKEILACTKCGFLVKREDIPKKIPNGNFFIKD